MLDTLQIWVASLQAWLQSWMSVDAGLWGLFFSAFLSATVLPGSSEVVMTALITAYPQLVWPALGAALVGNLMGGTLTFGMGWAGQRGYARFQGVHSRVMLNHPRVEQLRRRGPPVLVLAFLPLVGDALVLAAGWLRMPFWQSMAWIAVGKAARYLLLLAGLKGVLALT
jgi:membrane protein YqaA with SNARE-associated domain